MSVHKYIKLHIIRARWSKILACTVTEGEENDSPQLRKLPNQIPKYMEMKMSISWEMQPMSARRTAKPSQNLGEFRF